MCGGSPMLLASRLARACRLPLVTRLFVSCGANALYRGVAVTSLSDEQLVGELVSAAQGLGVEVNRTMYLMAVRPEPAYVLTSSTTTFSGSANATYNAYVMSTRYRATAYGQVPATV